MSTGFGLYVTAIGVGLVFLALLAVAILSKVLTGVFKVEEEPVGEEWDEGKIAAVAAVITSMVEHPKQGSGITWKRLSQWEAAARMESMERDNGR